MGFCFLLISLITRCYENICRFFKGLPWKPLLFSWKIEVSGVFQIMLNYVKTILQLTNQNGLGYYDVYGIWSLGLMISLVLRFYSLNKRNFLTIRFQARQITGIFNKLGTDRAARETLSDTTRTFRYGWIINSVFHNMKFLCKCSYYFQTLKQWLRL